MKRYLLLTLAIIISLSACSNKDIDTSQYEDDNPIVYTSFQHEMGKKVELNKVWSYISTGDESDNEDIEYLFGFLHNEFKLIFGNEYIDSIKCTIYVDYSNDENIGPYTHYKFDNELKEKLQISDNELAIRLHLPDGTSMWNKLVFQLAHEMTHYVFSQTYDYKNLNGSNWNEEIICEAMSLYMLKQFGDKWDECELGKRYNQTGVYSYSSAFYHYIYAPDDNGNYNNYNYYKLDDLNSSKNKDGISILEFIEWNRVAGDVGEREKHNTECNYIYDLLRFIDKEQINSIVLDMYKYLTDDCYIDYGKWVTDTKYKDIIEKVSKIQPIINQ